jgi:hypothetical protein
VSLRSWKRIRRRPAFRWPVESSIEGEVKEKYLPCRWSFSCFQPHAIKLGVFWPAARWARMLNMAARRFRFSFPAVFIALRDEALEHAVHAL